MGLIAALAEVAAAPVSCLSTDALASRVVVLESARARLDAVLSVTLAEADAAGVSANHGLRTIDQFVASRTHVDPSVVRADVRLGRWLFDFPELATARMCRHVMNSKSRTLDLGTTTRQAPEWMRTAIFVEARGQCRTAGCNAPFSWLEADHREPPSKRGPTAVENLDSLCAPDNRWKSDGPPLPERTKPPAPSTETLWRDAN